MKMETIEKKVILEFIDEMIENNQRYIDSVVPIIGQNNVGVGMRVGGIDDLYSVRSFIIDYEDSLYLDSNESSS